MRTDVDENQLRRFELRNGQFFAFFRYKNLHWFLDGKRIGFGDLRDEDIGRIAFKLRDDEEFIGWNEHHGTSTQQTNTPMVRIRPAVIVLRDEILKTEGH